jgi:hypothetical protein
MDQVDAVAPISAHTACRYLAALKDEDRRRPLTSTEQDHRLKALRAYASKLQRKALQVSFNRRIDAVEQAIMARNTHALVSSDGQKTRAHVSHDGQATRDHVTQELKKVLSRLPDPAPLIDSTVPLEGMHSWVQATIRAAAPLVDAKRLMRDGLTRYLDVLQMLVTDPPAVGSIDVRGLACTDLSTIAERLNLSKWKGKVSWQTLEQVRADILNMTSTEAGSYVLKLVSFELACRNVKFIEAQPAIRPPGTLARARVKKLVHTVVLTEPTVWTEPAPLLAYKLIDLDDGMKMGSCTVDNVLEDLHVPTGVDLKLAVAHQDPEHSAFLAQVEKLPWSQAKVAKILAALGMTVESKEQCAQLAEWASTMLPERIPVTFCAEVLWASL